MEFSIWISIILDIFILCYLTLFFNKYISIHSFILFLSIAILFFSSFLFRLVKKEGDIDIFFPCCLGKRNYVKLMTCISKKSLWLLKKRRRFKTNWFFCYWWIRFFGKNWTSFLIFRKIPSEFCYMFRKKPSEFCEKLYHSVVLQFKNTTP